MSTERPRQSENLETQQLRTLQMLAQAGAWKEIDPGMFPVLPKPMVEQARQEAFDARTSYIISQMEQLESLSELFDDNEQVGGTINGRMEEIKIELGEMIRTRFPETKIVKPDKISDSTAHLDRDVNAAIQFFISQGEVEQLTPKKIPALKHLKPETLLELKIDALLARLARYNEWKSANQNDKLGFPQTTGTQKSDLDTLADRRIEKTIMEIERLADERLGLSTLK
jgi:hypothetical protein